MSLEKFVVVRCSERLNMPRRAAMHCTAPHGTGLDWTALQCTALHYRPKRVRGPRAIQSRPIEAGDLVLTCPDSISPWLA